jgi:pimeloyl-ACP methyl ester carboxylesterase
MHDRRGLLARTRTHIAYRDSGAGKSLVFCHALATRRELWDPQHSALSGKFRIVSFDLRGHGESPALR